MYMALSPHDGLYCSTHIPALPEHVKCKDRAYVCVHVRVLSCESASYACTHVAVHVRARLHVIICACGRARTCAYDEQGEELSRAYAAADVFVMPSESETLGFVVLEAMASQVRASMGASVEANTSRCLAVMFSLLSPECRACSG